MIVVDQEEARRRLRAFVAEETYTARDAFDDATPLFDAGILDSVSLVSLVAFCEEHFGCRVPPEEITYDAFRSIASIAEAVTGRWAS